MNTPSHWIITAAVGQRWPRLWRMRQTALWGSVAPDLPLYGLTLGGMIYYHLILGWDLDQAMQYMFRELFFKNPVWITLHNGLHSPTLLGILGWLSWHHRHHLARQGSWILTFLASCGLHTLIDIPVHAEDGPLLLFPFEWTIRFRSPISYWDPRYWGHQFAWFEGGLVLILLSYLASRWWRRSNLRGSDSRGSDGG